MTIRSKLQEMAHVKVTRPRNTDASRADYETHGRTYTVTHGSAKAHFQEKFLDVTNPHTPEAKEIVKHARGMGYVMSRHDGDSIGMIHKQHDISHTHAMVRGRAHELTALLGAHSAIPMKESCTTTPGEKSIVWHEGIRYQFRNGMWATPRGYVWPNTDLCRELDQKHEEHVASGQDNWKEDQQGVGVPQTVAGGKQFAGNVEDRQVNLKVGQPAKEGTPNTDGTSPNESVEKVEERGLKPYALAPFSSWGQVGYERRLYTLFTRAAYTNEAEAGKAENPKVEEVDEAKRGRPRDLIGVREYQGKGSPRKRIRRADGKWHWASKNRV